MTALLASDIRSYGDGDLACLKSISRLWSKNVRRRHWSGKQAWTPCPISVTNIIKSEEGAGVVEELVRTTREKKGRRFK